jgi:hypothetical protein
MIALQDKLPAALCGKYRPTDAKEQLGFAGLCAINKHYGAAVEFYTKAFAAQPRLADDPDAGHRYDAASCAARASFGQGEEVSKLDEKESTGLRQQALTWLQADLAVLAQRLEKGGPMSPEAFVAWSTLLNWQVDTNLASLRDPAALAKLPKAERAQWTMLWADVAALLKKADDAAKK